MSKFILLILFSLFVHHNINTQVSISEGYSSDTSKHINEDSITVYLFLLDECVICHSYMPLINELFLDYQSEDIQFVGIFPNTSSKYAGIEKFKQTHDIQFVLKTDHYKKLSRYFDVKVTPEVVVYRHRDQQILYQGRIDNNFVQIGKRRRVVTTHELANALQSIVENQVIEVKNTESVGCFINFNEN